MMCHVGPSIWRKIWRVGIRDDAAFTIVVNSLVHSAWNMQDRKACFSHESISATQVIVPIKFGKSAKKCNLFLHSRFLLINNIINLRYYNSSNLVTIDRSTPEMPSRTISKLNTISRIVPNHHIFIKFLLIAGFVVVYILFFNNNPCCYVSILTRPSNNNNNNNNNDSTNNYKFVDSILSTPTDISHVVFAIAGTTKTWMNRKHYIEAWWRPNKTRGYVFLERLPREHLRWPKSSPPFKISQDTSKYKEYDKHPIPQAIRMTRIISEAFDMETEGVRWYVLADDDTVLFVDNLVGVLGRYDHNKYYYVGMGSESHGSNMLHSFGMGFGGAGYALSFPLAKALVSNLDECLKMYPTLYGSDHIVQSCVADLGVSITQEKGFHQVNILQKIFNR